MGSPSFHSTPILKVAAEAYQMPLLPDLSPHPTWLLNGTRPGCRVVRLPLSRSTSHRISSWIELARYLFAKPWCLKQHSVLIPQVLIGDLAQSVVTLADVKNTESIVLASSLSPSLTTVTSCGYRSIAFLAPVTRPSLQTLPRM